MRELKRRYNMKECSVLVSRLSHQFILKRTTRTSKPRKRPCKVFKSAKSGECPQRNSKKGCPSSKHVPNKRFNMVMKDVFRRVLRSARLSSKSFTITARSHSKRRPCQIKFKPNPYFHSSPPSTSNQKERPAPPKVRRSSRLHPREYPDSPQLIPPPPKCQVLWPTIPYGLDDKSILSVSTVTASSSEFEDDDQATETEENGDYGQVEEKGKKGRVVIAPNPKPLIAPPPTPPRFPQTRVPPAYMRVASHSHDFTLDFPEPFIDPALHPFDDTDNAWIDEMLSGSVVADIFRRALDDNFCPDIPDLLRLTKDDPLPNTTTSSSPPVCPSRNSHTNACVPAAVTTLRNFDEDYKNDILLISADEEDIPLPSPPATLAAAIGPVWWEQARDTKTHHRKPPVKTRKIF